MSATRLRNIDKRLEYVTDRVKSVQEEETGFIPKPSPIILKAARRVLPFSVATWSIVELPIEMILAQSPTERLGSVAGCLIWVAFAFGAMYKKRFASAVFLFLCAVSSIVVAQALPIVYESSAVVFSVSVVDLVLKVSTLLASLILRLMAPYPR
ncbi:hypothetical protein VSR68_10555 [Paraburkholderia phymatum]|uniref:hypothetical protein n=1 Tax=Paraburkholderia phymatum TaxID=148447 RepID=UPI003181E587